MSTFFDLGFRSFVQRTLVCLNHRQGPGLRFTNLVPKRGKDTLFLGLIFFFRYYLWSY